MMFFDKKSENPNWKNILKLLPIQFKISVSTQKKWKMYYEILNYWNNTWIITNIHRTAT